MMTYKDIYKLPLHKAKYAGRVHDADSNFVFQFMRGVINKEQEDLVIRVINGEEKIKNPKLIFHHDKGYIKDNEYTPYILIRGWGNLTGIGAHNLSIEDAANIQDTFAEFIVEQLNKRE